MFADLGLRIISTACFVLPVLCFLYTAALCVYRLKFHPYAKYPGPLLAKLTNLYGLYHAYLGDMHVDVWRCHERYGMIKTRRGELPQAEVVEGDYVRYAPDRVCINTNDAIKGRLL